MAGVGSYPAEKQGGKRRSALTFLVSFPRLPPDARRPAARERPKGERMEESESPRGSPPIGRQRPVGVGWTADLAACLAFGSRLPIPPSLFPRDASPAAPGRVLRFFPIAGAILSAVGAGAFVAAQALGLGSFVSAVLAFAVLTLVTGGLHEDGLADTADGFAGGGTPARRLEIMRDSRIGTFGASALVFSYLLRVGALAGLADRSGSAGAAAALVIAGTLSRSACLLPMALLPPARNGGLGRAYANRLFGDQAVSWALSAAIAAGLGWLAALSAPALVLAFLLATGAGLGVARLAKRLIGGQTGDVAGAAQQTAEAAALLGLLIALPR